MNDDVEEIVQARPSAMDILASLSDGLSDDTTPDEQPAHEPTQMAAPVEDQGGAPAEPAADDDLSPAVRARLEAQERQWQAQLAQQQAEWERREATLRGQVLNAAQQAEQRARQEVQAEWDKREAERREAERAQIRADIEAEPDATRQAQFRAHYAQLWADEDRKRLEAERQQFEQERQQLGQATEYLRQQAEIARARQQLPQLMAGWGAQRAANEVAAILGRPVDPQAVAAFYSSPAVLQRAAEYLPLGGAAMNIFGKELAMQAAQHIQAQEQGKEANRQAAVADGAHGRPERVAPKAGDAAWMQFRANPEKRRSGDTLAMLEALPVG